MEVIQDYKQHFVGEREVVNWDCLVDGQKVTYYNVPVMFLRELTRPEAEAHFRHHPTMTFSPDALCWWEVSAD